MIDPPGSGRKVWLGILIGVLVVAVIAGGGVLLANGLLGGSSSPSPQLKPVPRLIGLDQAAAVAALTEAGFTKDADITTRQSAQPVGTVIQQDPIAGTATSTDAVVKLVVAKAIKQIPVPSLSTMTVDEARAALTVVGLKLGPPSTGPSDAPVGTVISQDPAAGTPVDKGTIVSVVTSSGPASVAVLDVVCLPYGNAKAKLQQARFVVVDGGPATSINTSCPAQNRVAAQDPGPGPAAAGSTVTLFTNPAPSPSPSPSPTP